MIDIHALHGALSFAGYLTLFTFSGLVIAKMWLVPAPAFQLPEVFPRWRQMLGECFALLAFSGVMLLLVRTAEMDDGTLPTILADLPSVLMLTHFGHVWTVHLAMLALVWLGYARAAPPPSAAWGLCMVAALLVVAFTYSASSHASDGGDFTPAELNDWLHVASTAAWGGAILASVVFVFPSLQEHGALAETAASRLSMLAATALPFALATGICNTWLQVRAPEALLGTAYGRILIGKLVAVVALLLIGALNRFVVVPRVGRQNPGQAQAAAFCDSGPLRQLFVLLAVDSAFVLLAIVIAAILVQNEAA